MSISNRRKCSCFVRPVNSRCRSARKSTVLPLRSKGFTSVPVYGGTNGPPDARSSQRCQCRRRYTWSRDGSPSPQDSPHNAISLCIWTKPTVCSTWASAKDIEIILGDMPENRQNLFFSATMNRGVEGLIHAFSKNPQEISIERKALTVDTIEQELLRVRNRSKIMKFSAVYST